jgi:TatD DNase family protein
MIDIGLNLTNKKFINPHDTIISASEHGVTGLILTGTTLKGSAQSIDLCKKYGHLMMLRCTVGVHPHDSHSWTPDHYEKLSKLITDNIGLVVAVGETGLDYNQQRMFSTYEQQYIAFKSQIKLALHHSLPLFLHDRESFNDFKTMLMAEDPDNKLKKVVHCFTSGYNELKQYLDMGCYIGITGWISDNRRNHDLIDALTRLNSDAKYSALLRNYLMIETDAPFLSPLPHIRFNEPKYLIHVLEKLSDVLNISIIEMKAICYHNTLNAFNLHMSCKLPETIKKVEELPVLMSVSEPVVASKPVFSYKNALLKK